MSKNKTIKSIEQLTKENVELRVKLQEAEETLQAIREGAVDAVVVSGPKGEKIFTLSGEEQVYRHLVETMSEAGLTTTPEGKILFCNERFGQMLHRPMAEIIGQPLEKFVQRSSQDILSTLLSDSLLKPTRKRLIFETADGTPVPSRVSANLLHQDDSVNICLVAMDLSELEASLEINRQINEQREQLKASERHLKSSNQYLQAKEQELRDANQHLRDEKKYSENIITTIGEMLIVLDPDGKIRKTNQTACDVLGYSEKELIGLRIGAVIEEEEELATLTKQGVVGKVEKIFKAKNGHKIPVLFSGNVMHDSSGKIIGLVCVARDITERKQAEEYLEKKQEQLDLAQKAANIGIWDWNVQTGKIEWSGPMFTLFGLDPNKDVPCFETWRSVLHPADVEIAGKRIEQALKEQTILNSDYRIVLPDGQIRWINSLGQGKYDHEGKPIRMIGTCIDITERKQHEELLQKTNAYLENLLNYANAPIIVWNNQYKIIRFNHAFEKLTGLKEADVLGKDLGILFPRDQVESSMQLIKDTMKGDHWDDVEIGIRHIDGSIRIVLWNSATIVFPGNNIPEATIAQGHDISERKSTEEALRKSEERLKYHFENSPLGVVEWTHDFIVTQWSSEAEHIFGWKKEEALGKRIDTLNIIYTEDIPIVNLTLERLTSGKERTVISTKRNFTKSGAVIDCTWYNSVILDHNGKMESVMSLVQDITQSKQMEEELSMAKSLAEGANLAKTVFLAEMSHDIRTPMNAIMGFTELLKEEQLSEAGKDKLRIIKRSGQHLLQLLNNIIDISAIEAGKLQINKTQFNLQDLLCEVFELIEGRVTNGVVLKRDFGDDSNIELLGDVSRIKQILLNLLDNSAKYTDKGFVKLSCRLMAIKAGSTVVKILVEDTGPGIRIETGPGNINKYTTKRADSKPALQYPAYKKRSGSGFGLNISKKLAEMMEGGLEIKSEKREGTSITIRLKLQLAPKAKGAGPQLTLEDHYQTNKSNCEKNILVAEDDDINQIFVSALLQKLGFNFTIVDDGKQVLEKLKQDSFDLILMDIKMQGMDGFIATEEIRRTGNKIPIIAVTAQVMKDDHERGSKVGINEWIYKPINISDFTIKLEKWTRNSVF